MKKTFKNIKGFAMAELLAICIVILVIFSLLFSNYLPLLAEYEKRISYNDVTAEYAAHYVRKIYLDALESNTDLTSTINQAINDSGFYQVYKKGVLNNPICQHAQYPGADAVKKTKLEEKCNNLISAYGIEEIIITNYQLKGNQTSTKYVKNYSGNNGYLENNGSLYSYINYLPNYEKSIYTGKDQDNMQLYRIILKTKDFGYATTPIYYDYKTPSSCFEAASVGNRLSITNYKYDGDECGEIVTISNKKLTISGKKGTVVAIGNKAFKGKDITEVIYDSSKLKTIGDNAFSETNLTKFDLEGLNSVGNQAFSNIENLTEITIPNGTNFGDQVFLDDNMLSDIKIEATDKIIKTGEIEPTGLFEGCATEGEEGIQVNTKDLTSIPPAMFKNAYVTGITLGNTLTNIGNHAFFQDSNSQNPKKSYATSLNFPSALKIIGESAFQNFGLSTSIDTSLLPNLTTIGGNSFNSVDGVTTGNGATTGINNLTITNSVTEIGSSAFSNAGIESLNISGATGINQIKKFAFYSNPISNEVEVPSNITTIGESAFNGNTHADQTLSAGIKLNEGLETIGLSAFANTALQSITIPKTVKTIGVNAFDGLSKLTTVTIPSDSNLKTIGINAFQNNTAIEKFTIPKSVTTIGESAFDGCSKLATKEGDFINNSNISIQWCKVLANNPQIATDCTESTSGQLVTISYKLDIGTPMIKYITNGSGG